MSKISKTAKSIDTFNTKVSKGVTKFSKHVDAYVDTSVYQKDSSGKWIKK